MARVTFTGIASGNLGDHVGDDPDKVAANRRALEKSLSLPKIIFMNQSHSSQVEIVNSETDFAPNCDAIVTTDKSLGLAVLTADCLPILVESNSVVGALHAGRKGVTNGLIQRTIATMTELGATQMRATIGPAICANCYEVSRDMYLDLTDKFPALESGNGSSNLDLINGARAQLQSLGVEVEVIAICTKESKDHFSYRRENETGRQVGVIAL